MSSDSTGSAGPGRDRNRRSALLAVALLSFATGVTDAFAFSCLGGIFTANMTGNLILLGMFSRPGYPDTFIGASIALFAFLTGTYTGFKTVPRAKARPKHLLCPLGLAFCLKLTVAAVWGTVGGIGGVRECVIALSSGALGLQTALIRRLSGLGGITTTYMTGTMTAALESLADQRRVSALALGSAPCLIAGAVAGTACITWTAWTAPILAAACIALASPAVSRIAAVHV